MHTKIAAFKQCYFRVGSEKEWQPKMDRTEALVSVHQSPARKVLHLHPSLCDPYPRTPGSDPSPDTVNTSGASSVPRTNCASSESDRLRIPPGPWRVSGHSFTGIFLAGTVSRSKRLLKHGCPSRRFPKPGNQILA